MGFSDEQINQINRLCKRIEPCINLSIQFRTKDNDLRTGIIIGIKNKKGQYICLYTNFDPLNRAKTKILEIMIKRLPFETYITYPREDITRVGWKCAK